MFRAGETDQRLRALTAPCKGLELGSHHRYINSQSATPDLEDLMSSSSLHRPLLSHVCYNTHTYN